MITLCLEFSAPLRSVALAEIDFAARVSRLLVEEQAAESTASNPLEWLDAALRKAGLSREAIQCVLIGTGPGSYTGIRSAIALAQGLQLARGVKVAGMPSIDAIALAEWLHGYRGRLGIVLDAQRGDVYLAEFELGLKGAQRLGEIQLLRSSNILAMDRAAIKLVGPEIARWLPDLRNTAPCARHLAELAGPETNFVPAEQLEPIYLRQNVFVKAPPPLEIP